MAENVIPYESKQPTRPPISHYLTRRRVGFCLTLFSLIALVARVGAIFYLHGWDHPYAMEHRFIAYSLATNGTFSFSDWGHYGSTSVQSPPYPFLLATLFKIFGTHVPVDGSLHGANLAYFTALMINAIAGAGMVWLTYSMARTLGATPLAGLLAAAAVAIWPSQIYAARMAQAVVIITAALAAMIILFYQAVRTGKRAPWIGYAIIATIATLTEPVFLPALAISGGLVLIWRGLAREARLRNAIILIVAVVVIIGPWAARNYYVHRKMVPIKDTFWVNVWKGNNDHATGTDRLELTAKDKTGAKMAIEQLQDSKIPDGEHQYDALTLDQRALLQGRSEVSREEVFKNFAVTWIKKNPNRYLQLCGIRLITTLTVDWNNPKATPMIYIVTRFALLALSVLGLFVAIKQKWSLLFPGIIVATALLTYTLTVTAARFSIPFEPLQLCLAGAFIAACVERNPASRSVPESIEASPRVFTGG
jgi:4-amino-4-deoxy-L-arabinose transferase-like glycosyltransferase